MSSRNCGYKIFTPAGQLIWDPTLARAALNHSVDMATKDFVSHKGSSGGGHIELERLVTAGPQWERIYRPAVRIQRK